MLLSGGSGSLRSNSNVAVKSSRPQIAKRKHKYLDVESINEDNFTLSQIKAIDREVFGAIDYYYEILKDSHYQDLLRFARDDVLIGVNTDKRLGMRIIYNDRRSAEADAGARGFTLYAGLRNLYCTNYDLLGADSPAYAAIHELHHLFGSQTEFDVGSEAAYIGFVFEERFKDPRYDAIKPFIVQKTRDMMYAAKHPSQGNTRLHQRDLNICTFIIARL